MKWILIFLFSALAVFGIVKKSGCNEKLLTTAKQSQGGFAVIELFTSEGCSSCPAADRLLPQLASLDSNIIPLSFHVDYWDRYGWKDPFSNALFSERQREYAKQFKLESMYTPQLIINGQRELVGSNRILAETGIKKALAEKPVAQLKIDEVKINGNNLFVALQATGEINEENLLAVVVQKHAETNVTNGENHGATLSHTNVVRSFKKQTASEKMNIELPFPSDLGQRNWELVLYLQQKNTLRVTGAVSYAPKG